MSDTEAQTMNYTDTYNYTLVDLQALHHSEDACIQHLLHSHHRFLAHKVNRGNLEQILLSLPPTETTSAECSKICSYMR